MDCKYMPIVSIESLKIGYHYGRHQKILLPPLNATAARGEMVAVIGRNGIGKSTLLRTLVGLQQPIGGTITISGKELTGYSRLGMARVAGYISTENVRVNNMKIIDLVALGRYPHTNWTGRITTKDREEVYKAIERTGLNGLENRFVSELSDGERQRAMIARVLAQDTEIMVMDEPTAFLDITNRFEVVNLMHELTQRGKTILFSTHDFNIAMRQADKIWLMLGTELAEGAPEDLVLGGTFEQLFDTSAGRINYEEGSFEFRKQIKGKIHIGGEGKLKYWTEKAVSRAGYEISSAETLISVRIPSGTPGKWTLFKGDSSAEFTTLYELVRNLNAKNR
ncbi:MAG: ABC transporter ATP-binding protein [Bacteroidales bacterium]|nr:ABC transporter ATP-binding protein [Bacteroidales bacterium]